MTDVNVKLITKRISQAFLRIVDEDINDDTFVAEHYRPLFCMVTEQSGLPFSFESPRDVAYCFVESVKMLAKDGKYRGDLRLKFVGWQSVMDGDIAITQVRNVISWSIGDEIDEAATLKDMEVSSFGNP